MTKKEFRSSMDKLQAHKSRGEMSHEQLELRLLDFWKEFKDVPVDDFERGVDWYIRHAGPYFPQLDEMIHAIEASPRGKKHDTDCPACDGTGWVPVALEDGATAVRRCRGKEEQAYNQPATPA